MILEGFYAILAADAGVLALVGTTPPRLHYGNRPQGERDPAVVLQLITDTPGADMQGAAPYSDGTVRLNCFGTTYLQAADVAQAVTDAVNGFKGTAGPVNFGSVYVGPGSEIPRIVPEGQSGPNVFGIYLDVSYVQKT